jgi:hypothetical protein
MLNFAPLDKLRSANVGTPIALLIAMFFVPQFLDFDHPIAPTLVIVAVLGIAGFLVYSVRKIMIANSQNSQAYLEFAQANNFEYVSANPTYAHGSGTLFTHGHSQNYRHIISGVRSDKLPFAVFRHTYDTGSGKSRTTHFATVMRIQLPRVLPHMVIDSHAEGGSSNTSVLPIEFDRSQRIELEGDFHKYFSLYAPDKYGVGMLSIIGPDTMWVLMEHAAACDIEIIDNNLYFYWPFGADDRGDYERIFATVDAVLTKIGKKLTKADIYATHDQALVHSNATSQGVRLAANPKFLGSMVGVVLIAIYAVGIFLGELAGWFNLIYMVVPLVVFGVIIWQLIKASQAHKLRNQLAKRFGKPTVPAMTTWQKLGFGIPMVVGLLLALGVAIQTIAAYQFANNSGTPSAGSSVPDRAALFTEREAVRGSMTDNLTIIENQTPGLTFQAEATHDKCGTGQNNYKVQEGYKYICVFKITRFYSFNSDFAQTASAIEQTLAATNWRPNGDSLTDMINKYYTPRLQKGTLEIGALPKPQYAYDNEVYKGGLLEFRFIDDPAKPFPGYIQRTFIIGPTTGIPDPEETNAVDVQSLSAYILANFKYGMSIEMSRTYYYVPAQAN